MGVALVIVVGVGVGTALVVGVGVGTGLQSQALLIPILAVVSVFSKLLSVNFAFQV